MEGTAPFSSRPASGGAWGAWLLVASGASTVVIVAGWLSSSLTDSTSGLAARMPVVWIIAMAMAALAVGARSAARGAFGPRALVFTSIASLCTVPAVALGAFFVASRVIIQSSRTESLGDLVTGVVLLFAVAVAALLVLPVAMLVANRHARALDAALAGAAYLAIGGSLVLGILGAARAIGRPDADTYVASLPKIVELPAYAITPRFEATVGSVRVHREPSEEPPGLCPFRLEIDGVDGKVGLRETIRSSEKSACGRLALRHDARADLWVFSNEDGPRPAAILAMSGKDFTTTSVDTSRVANALGAPVGWIAEAFAAGFAGIAIVLYARRRTRALRALLDATPATHDGDGALRLADGSPPFHSSAAASLARGPVLLTLARVDSAGAYRDAATPTVTGAVAGTPTSIRAALSSARAGAHALALVVVLLAASPLAIAALILG